MVAPHCADRVQHGLGWVPARRIGTQSPRGGSWYCSRGHFRWGCRRDDGAIHGFHSELAGGRGWVGLMQLGGC